uniref:Uncharacterized protein n=1 Tax=Glossina palpalis gambiensis TaxID=67801 RepID=A0A1B0AR38_9MUSC
MKTFRHTRKYSLVTTKEIHKNLSFNYQYNSRYQYRQHKRFQTRRIDLRFVLQSLFFLFCVNILPLCSCVGYSYTRFVGPVRGPEQVYVTDDPVSGRQHLDYIAKPEYEFSYGVEDTEARILHNRNEIRDGDDVKGVYSLVDPDGTLRVVRYTADNVNGFKAEVITNGLSTIHGAQLSPFPSLSPSPSPTPTQPPTPSVNVYHPVLGLNPDLQRFVNPSYSNQRPQPQQHRPQLPPTLLPVTFHPSPTPQLYHKINQNTEHKEYRPQYKVHESQEEDDDDSDDSGQKGGKQKKKKEEDGGGDGDDDDDDDGSDDEQHDYNSEEDDDVEDYDENVKKNIAYQGEENDEDY